VTGNAIDLVGSDVRGQLLQLSGGTDGHLLARRNFAILKPEDSTGTKWDPNGNLWVELYADENGKVAMYEQCLLGPGA
jgi:hypothetical protein